jgi:hypothetical protein
MGNALYRQQADFFGFPRSILLKKCMVNPGSPLHPPPMLRPKTASLELLNGLKPEAESEPESGERNRGRGVEHRLL